MGRRSLIALGVIALMVMVFGVPSSEAYPTYSQGKVLNAAGEMEPFGYCKTCHGHFRATDETNSRAYLQDEYVSPVDGKLWREIYTEVTETEAVLEVGLHDVHRHVMVDKLSRSRCDTCHDRATFGGFYPVSLSQSSSTFLEPISCLGCHGRWEDLGNDSGSLGLGAGLRQHHTSAGITACKTCHSDADPANYAPVGENVLPPYYFTPDPEFPNKPTDPCNLHDEEDYAGGPTGLDNDGDGNYDMSDKDCSGSGNR